MKKNIHPENPAKQERLNRQAAATYRVILKRVIRAAVGTVDNDAPTNRLESSITNLIQVAPAVVARGLENIFEQSAKAWVKGNNSGNQAILEIENENCERLQNCGERILKLWGVIVDYPGLYPSFNYRGADYHDCLSLCRAIAAAKGK